MTGVEPASLAWKASTCGRSVTSPRWLRRRSNPRPALFQRAALPTELRSQVLRPRNGVSPTTAARPPAMSLLPERADRAGLPGDRASLLRQPSGYRESNPSSLPPKQARYHYAISRQHRALPVELQPSVLSGRPTLALPVATRLAREPLREPTGFEPASPAGRDGPI